MSSRARPNRPAARRRLRAALGALCAGMVLATPAATRAEYEIEVNKSARTLTVRNGESIERVFNVATGRGGKGDKQRSGDNKTPVGVYRIVGFNDNSQFEFFMQLNYPNVKDAFYGLKRKVIDREQFDRILAALRRGRVPPQDTALGGQIGIHGIGEINPEKIHIHEALDWTEGCIALTNEEVHELRRYVSVGTVVVIKE